MTRISVVIPTFNSEVSIAKAIYSVLNQTKQAYEVIISDNLSTDSTLKIVARCIQDNPHFRIKITTCSLVGAGPNRNHAVSCSAGNIIAFLDADDVWDSRFLEIMTDHLLENDVIRGCLAIYRDATGRPYGTSIRPRETRKLGSDMLEKGRMPFLLSSWVLTKELFEDLNGFNPDYVVSQDFEFMYRHLSTGGSVEIIEKFLLFYTIHTESESTQYHLQQKATAHYVMDESIRKRFTLTEYLNSNKGLTLTVRRQSYADRLVRRYVNTSRHGYFGGIYLLFWAIAVSPIRVLGKIARQRPVVRIPRLLKNSDL